ncbi:MAG: hypothetical protein AAGF49_12510, partial [Pseudomonadota bacterium]
SASQPAAPAQPAPETPVIEPLPEILPPPPEPQQNVALATRSDPETASTGLDATSPREVLPNIPPAATRVVGEAPDARRPAWSNNEDVVAALQDLDYLSTEVDPTQERVEAAVDEFAIDERFALPVPQDVLLERLDAAIERSETLPTCAADAPEVCFAVSAR